MGEYSIPGRRYLWRVANEEMDFHLQCFQQGHENINRCLVFRDYLRAHPNKIVEYSKAKERASKMHPEDAHAYWEEKKETVEKLIKEALNWQENNSVC